LEIKLSIVDGAMTPQALSFECLKKTLDLSDRLLLVFGAIHEKDFQKRLELTQNDELSETLHAAMKVLAIERWRTMRFPH
jgi:folylpolyglutamate synthase/dihydropteroate synthase